MLNIKKRSKIRRLVQCDCNICNGKYVNLRTKNKHSLNRNIATNTSVIEDDPMIESSRSFINEKPSPSLPSFINEELTIESQENISQSENLAILSSKMRKRSRNNALWKCDIQMSDCIFE